MPDNLYIYHIYILLIYGNNIVSFDHIRAYP